MKILSLVPYKVFPAVMGGQKGIALFYHYLAKVMSITVLTTEKNTTHESFEVINEIGNSKWRYLNPLLFFRIKYLAKKRNVTHLLFEHPYYAWLILLFRFFSSFQIIVHSHNIESERFKSVGKWWWKLLWYYERTAYRKAHTLWFKTYQDMQYSIIHYKISPKRCFVIPYGIEAEELPHANETEKANRILQQLYKLLPEERIILFNGTLSYKPNLDALIAILEKINPGLLATDFQYKILICGKNLPPEWKDLKNYSDKNIIYCGFVEDIDLYFRGCHLFLNPLMDGGGIKTKLVEALGFGKYCISSENGAIGVDASVTGGRLRIVPDKDWDAYCKAIIDAPLAIHNNNELFYDNFSWKNVAQKASESLQ